MPLLLLIPRPVRTRAAARFLPKVLLLLLFGLALPVAESAAQDVLVGVYENRPQVFQGDDGRWQGLAVEVLEHIAEKERWNLLYAPGTWQENLDRLQDGRINLLLSIAQSESRSHFFDFSTHALLSNWGQAYVGRDSSLDSILDLEGKKVAVLKGDIFLGEFRRLTEAFGVSCELVEMPDYPSLFALLQNGSVDVVIANRLVGLDFENAHSARKTSIVFHPIQVRFAVPKGRHPEILQAIDLHLGRMKADKNSFYYAALDRWLGDPLPSSLPSWVVWIAGALFGGLVLTLGMSLLLRAQVRERTAQLAARSDDLERRIAEKKEAEAALVESEGRYRSFYLNTPVMLYSLDREGKLVSASSLLLENLGYSTTEMIGRENAELLTEESRRHWSHMAVTEFERNGAIRDFPLQMVKKDGEIIDVLLSAIAERDEKGETVHALCVLTDITRRKQAEAKIQQLAYYDMLTGLPNRALFKDRLVQAIAHARRDGKHVAVLAVDLDRFKGINDTLGHGYGDRLLRIMAERLKGCLRRTDTVARLGGDEFAVILSGVYAAEDITPLIRKIQQTVAQPVRLDEQQIYSTASIGVTLYPLDGTNADSLLSQADTAMHVAKEQGRNAYQFFSQDMNCKALERLELETSLRHALDRGEFFLYYQPQVDLGLGRIVGVEALLRWRHPVRGIISPADFIPLAEETGLITTIGEWVLRRACIQAQEWVREGLPPIRMAVNLSGRQFRQLDLVEQIRSALAESALNPAFLELELTESILMDNAERVQNALQEIKKLGVLLALDDFGTGYCSLGYLKNFPIDRLKIAGTFVRDISPESGDAAIAEAIIAMGHSLRLKVIAEGVETREQLDFLHTRRCTEMQGYYFARPMPPEEMAEFLRKEFQLSDACPTPYSSAPPQCR